MMYQLPEIKPRKQPRPAYRKPDCVKELERLANLDQQRKHPNIDPKFLAPYKYEDRTANGLTKCVIDFLRLKGCQSERINCTGRYIDNTKVVLDVLDRHRVIGSVKWLPTSGQRGTSDISAVLPGGRAVKIEIKAGKDRQRPEQERYQADIERAGGTYLIIRSLTEFKEWFDSL